ncbi:MAG: penicillin acylase family protein [Halioglobus sp.]
MLKICTLALLSVLTLTACGDSNNRSSSPVVEPPEPTLNYSAEVRRTEYGIPHIKADDWGSLGYGFGYAYAQDNFCVVMREIIITTGRSAEAFGEEEGSTNSDFLLRFINGDKAEFKEQFFDQLPQYAKDLSEGYVAGLNRYLDETGVDNLPEGDFGCRGADWVAPIDVVDLALYLRRQALRGSSTQGIFQDAILSVSGPDGQLAASTVNTAQIARSPGLAEMAAELSSTELGSNGLVLGRDATQDGSGMLLGNPHQPWFGDGAWYMAHLTLPGEYDVAGASLQGFPFIGIGFNQDLAWTHTVSFANRFSLYELKLNPDNPLEYEFDGEWREINAEEITIKVKLADGSLEDRSFTIYSSHFGPIVNLGGLEPLLNGWPMFTGTVLSFRDANLFTGVRSVQQWIEKAQQTNIEDYRESLNIIGNPVFHDLAADRHGQAFYGEVSAVPFITQEQLDTCVKGIVGPLLATATTNIIITLDGSDSGCEWGDDPEAPAGSNLYSSGKLPQLQTTDYASNSNNSYWLSDANNPLEGFPTIMGPLGYEGLQQFLRTRLGHQMVAQRKTASDGLDDSPLFTLENLKDMMYLNRVYGADLVLDDVLGVCATEAAVDVQSACEVLADWDRKADLDSRGMQVFTEFWRAIREEFAGFQGVVESDEFWLVDFNPDDPVNTPAGIDLEIPANHGRVISGLSYAIDRLTTAGVSLDAPWGEVQYLQRNAENVPIHGGDGNAGVYGAIGVGLSEGGYINPNGGNSYIQAVTWDETVCPIADVILVPSQSTDPESPHFADQTKLYSSKEWIRFPFCEDEIVANQIGETLVLEE